MFNLQPQLLLHPNIPKPLHGVAPRTIKGDAWWNEQRQIAYSTNGYKCWACGVHKTEAKYHKWLEAHEIYEIDYAIGQVKFNGVCALCHSCHNFIHNGRLYSLLGKGEIDETKTFDVLTHGFEVLKNAKLKMNTFAMKITKEINPKLYNKYLQFGLYQYGFCLAEWGDWHMIVDGKNHFGKFKSFEDWKDFYARG
jgi:hypothetical protein